MKKNLTVKWVVVVLLSGIGAVVGYYAGHQANLVGWKMFWQVVGGIVLGFFVALSIFERRIFAWIGLAVGILLSILINVLLKAELGTQEVLLLVFVTTYIGFCLHQRKRPIIIGCSVGGVLGFALGLVWSLQIGRISYTPSFNTAILFSFTGILLGMFFGASLSYSSVEKE